MRRLLSVTCVAFMSGCANLKESGDKAIAVVENPPDAVWDSIKEIFNFIVSALVTFLTHLDPTTWF